MAELVLYTYPAMVVIAGWLLFRQRVARVQVLALAGSFAGVVLLVGGVRFGGGPALLLAIASPVIFTVYILVGARVMAGVPGIAAGFLSILGTALTWTVVAAATGNLRPPAGAPSGRRCWRSPCFRRCSRSAPSWRRCPGSAPPGRRC